MRRREFIALLGGAVSLPSTLWSFAVRAQPMPVVGFLSSASQASFEHLIAAFRQGLSEGGYIEGRNVQIEYRWAENHYERLPALAADLVSRHVTVIAASGANPPVTAAMAATSTIPIVFTGADDPVKNGLVSSFNRPGGNVTGLTVFSAEVEAKRLELLHDLAPGAMNIAVLFNPNNPNLEYQLAEIQRAQSAIGRPLIVLRAATQADIDEAFVSMTNEHVAALLVGADPFFNSRREQIVALAARRALPAIYAFRDFAVAGGLMSYGNSIPDGYRQAGIYVARILKGEKPADLPVMQPTKFELVINLRTAKTLGIDIPSRVLASADEIIE